MGGLAGCPAPTRLPTPRLVSPGLWLVDSLATLRIVCWYCVAVRGDTFLDRCTRIDPTEALVVLVTVGLTPGFAFASFPDLGPVPAPSLGLAGLAWLGTLAQDLADVIGALPLSTLGSVCQVVYLCHTHVRFVS